MTRILVVWLHIVAAAAWVGGLLHGSHLVVPALARGDRGALDLLTRGRALAWAALALVVVTGLDNLRRTGLQSPWLGGKLALVVGILALAAHRDWALLPRAAAAIAAGAAPAGALRGLRLVDRLLVLLALAVLLLAAGVARGR
jgi:putative copper export protein